jgi:protein-tyrosine phosphatase
LFWIEDRFPGRIAIVPRPRGSDWIERDVQCWRREGIDTLVSLLTAEESQELELQHESDACRATGIEFVSFPIQDRETPNDSEAFAELAQYLAAKLTIGQSIGVHCRQGIGRSALLVAAVLLAEGIELDAALRRISVARGYAVPETPEQRRWIEDYARRHSALTR